MRRSILFISIGIVFFAFGILITILALNDKKNTSAFLQPVNPLIFTSYWLIFMAICERKNKTEDEFFSYRSFTSVGGLAFVGKKFAAAFFMILFGTVSLAIAGSLLSASKNTADFSWMALGAGFIYGLAVIIYFQRKLGTNPEKSHAETEAEQDKTEINIAVFFASLATFGLFYIFWRYVIKKKI
jgi:hypothetical protein